MRIYSNTFGVFSFVNISIYDFGAENIIGACKKEKTC